MLTNIVLKSLVRWAILVSAGAFIIGSFLFFTFAPDERFDKYFEIKLNMHKQQVDRLVRLPNKKKLINRLNPMGQPESITRYYWYSRIDSFFLDVNPDGKVVGKHYWSEPSSTFSEYLKRRYWN
jgi:hypothetical protein